MKYFGKKSDLENLKNKKINLSDKTKEIIKSFIIISTLVTATTATINHILESKIDKVTHISAIEFDKKILKKYIQELPKLSDVTSEEFLYDYISIKPIDKHSEKTVAEHTLKNTEFLSKEIKQHPTLAINDITDLSLPQLHYLKKHSKFKYIVISSEYFSGQKKYEIGDVYSIDDMIKIKTFIEKYIGPIRDNKNLTQFEKFIAVTEVINAQTTYDDEAAEKNTRYSNAVSKTTRNMHNIIIHGEAVCMGYSDLLHQCCKMINVDSKLIVTYADVKIDKKTYNELVFDIYRNENLRHFNHAINKITFDDGRVRIC